MTTFVIKHYSGVSSHQGGVIAALVTIMIWASWLISIKIGAQSSLSTIDLAVLRYALTGLILLPVFYFEK